MPPGLLAGPATGDPLPGPRSNHGTGFAPQPQGRAGRGAARCLCLLGRGLFLHAGWPLRARICVYASGMLLKDIKTFVVGNPPPHFGGQWFVFVKLTTSDNISGIGESYGVPFHPDLVARMLEDVFGRYLEGQDPHDIEALW